MKGTAWKGANWLICLFTLPVFFLGTLVWAAEEVYPNRPVTIIVPYGPGGPLDLHSQLFGEKLSKVLGQPFVKENKPGGSGILGTSLVARGKADGYTLYPGTTSALVVSPIVSKVDYKLEDFASIGGYTRQGVILAVRADSKWKTLKDFVDDAKANPDKLMVSSWGKLSLSEFAITLFSKAAGIKLTHVPTNSTAEAMTALLGGHVNGAFVSSTGGQMEAGVVRVLGVCDTQRSSIKPDVKTFQEQGYPVSVVVNYAFFTHAKTPPKIVEKLSGAMREAFKRYGDEIRESLKKMEFEASYLEPQESIKKFREDYKIIYGAAKEMGVAVK